MPKLATSDDIIDIATKIVNEADKKGITLRVMGAVAVALHLNDHYGLWQELGRKLTDIDFVGYNKERKKIESMLKSSFGYEILESSLTPALYLRRIIWWDPSKDALMMPSGKKPLNGDVFLDKLQMNHTIEWKGRLHIDNPTIPLAEVVLQKTQIVGGEKHLGMGEKDVKDMICLLLDHDVGDSDDDRINAKVIADTLSNDWGFYHTATTNLKLLKEQWLPKHNLPKKDNDIILARIDKLLDAVENKKKSFKWKMRARIGTKKKWFQTVEEVERMEQYCPNCGAEMELGSEVCKNCGTTLKS
ncbi:MAG: zinc ribbon domain-containing protein [Promethearchaeota archaeon]